MDINWKPWHKVVALRPDLRTHELPMSMFAADLHEAYMQNGRHPIYENPQEFFSLTFPTHSLRKLAGEVCQRLAGKNNKAVRQLQLTYGGGKTHALITLMHLAREGENLPDLSAVEEFRQAYGGGKFPKARVAALCFDKIDAIVPIEVKSPSGEIRKLKQPWSILAWQIGGKEGLNIINPENPDMERDTYPSQEILGKLLEIPQKDNLGLLILIDEVLMYAHAKISQDSRWRGILKDFFQCLTQAVNLNNKCCLVASLLAHEAATEDLMGKSIQSELYDIFNRQREDVVEPVGKEEITEVLRRRFFTADSIGSKDKFRPHVQAALTGILEHTELDSLAVKRLEDRFYNSYPFHPDLTDIFYSKWTQIPRYQKTRGALRTFAVALRDAEKWDQAPVISAQVFLSEPDAKGLSEAALELVPVADNADPEGTQAIWSSILAKELEIAKEIQEELSLKFREIEQAVFAAFLHSQPLGQDAKLRDLTSLVYPTRPDKINLAKGLDAWANLSFWLDDAFLEEPGTLPKVWRLGRKPNLIQMHNQIKASLSNQEVENALLDALAKEKSLISGARQYGVMPHVLPASPANVPNDAQFRLLILGPECASDADNIAKKALRFLQEGASENTPRTYRNALIMIAPALEGYEKAKNHFRDKLAWDRILNNIRQQGKGAIEAARLSKLEGLKRIADTNAQKALLEAWTMAIVMSDKGQPECFKFSAEGADSHFNALKKLKRSRICEDLDIQTILPAGPAEYKLWQAGDKFKRVKDIYEAFIKYPHLPKLLKVRDLRISQGCEMGLFALRLTRPDNSARTWWMTKPDDVAMQDPELEIWLSEYADLLSIDPKLLEKGRLEGLWPQDEDAYITVDSVAAYFDGQHTASINFGGYDEPADVPKASREVVINALKEAVHEGILWLYLPPATSILSETPEDWMLGENTLFYPPPGKIAPMEIMPANLPDAWAKNEAANEGAYETTAQAIDSALPRTRKGRLLPWNIVREAITQAINNNFISLASDSAPWPCERGNAGRIKLLDRGNVIIDPQPAENRLEANAILTVSQLMNVADQGTHLFNLVSKYGREIDVAITLKVKESGANAEFIQELQEFLDNIKD